MEILHLTFTDLESIAWFFAIFLIAGYVSWKKGLFIVTWNLKKTQLSML